MRGNGRVFQRKATTGSNGSPFWWVSYYRQGKEVREIALHVRTGRKLEATEANRRKAEQFLEKRRGAVIAEQHGGPAFTGPVAERLTVDDLLDALKSNYELRHKWNERYACTFKKVREQFGSWRAVALGAEDVDAWQVDLQKQSYQDATINRFCQILGQAYKLAVTRKRLPTAPVITHLSEKGNARQGFLSEIEMRRVIAKLPDYLQDFVLFSYITGMRKSAVASLQWPAVHGDQITLPAVDNKTEEALALPLEGELAELIERRRVARLVRRGNSMVMSDFIFHRKGLPIASFRKAWARACKQAGVSGKLVHDLRRCAAKNLVDAGVPVTVAMTITGHKTLSMFKRYAIVESKLQRAALRQTEVHRAKQLATLVDQQSIPAAAVN